MSSDIQHPKKTIDRRTLLKAGAWAAPVIVLSTAAPAAAASGTATGKLDFTNVSYYWAYGPGGVVGLTANTTVGFKHGGTGTITSILLMVQINNANGTYLVGGKPAILLGAPGWTVSQVGTTIVDRHRVPWIQYGFLWTGTLVPIGYTALLEATFPLAEAHPNGPPAGSKWLVIASAPSEPNVKPAAQAGNGREFVDRGPVTP